MSDTLIPYDPWGDLLLSVRDDVNGAPLRCLCVSSSRLVAISGLVHDWCALSPQDETLGFMRVLSMEQSPARLGTMRVVLDAVYQRPYAVAAADGLEVHQLVDYLDDGTSHDAFAQLRAKAREACIARLDVEPSFAATIVPYGMRASDNGPWFAALYAKLPADAFQEDDLAHLDETDLRTTLHHGYRRYAKISLMALVDRWSQFHGRAKLPLADFIFERRLLPRSIDSLAQTLSMFRGRPLSEFIDHTHRLMKKVEGSASDDIWRARHLLDEVVDLWEYAAYDRFFGSSIESLVRQMAEHYRALRDRL